MVLKLFDLTKRVNSTMRPSGTSADYTIVFKEPTNILNPTFRIDTGGVYPTANYAQLDIAVGDTTVTYYYFINSIKSVNADIFDIICDIDPLATTKEDILNTTAFVIYSTSEYDRWLNDDRIPLLVKGSEFVHSSSAILVGEHALFEATSNETVLITVANGYGGIVTYVTDELGVKDIVEELTLSDGIWDDLVKQFGDAMGSIIQVMRMPVVKTALSLSAPHVVYLGNSPIENGYGGYLELPMLESTWVQATGSIGMPATYTDFRYSEPYSKAKLALPFVGVMDFSIATLAPSAGINWRLDLDLMTGAINWSLFSSTDNKQVASYSGQCGSLIPIASMQIANTAGIVTGGVSGAAATLGLAATGHELAATMSGIGTIANHFFSQLHMDTTIVGGYSGGRGEGSNRMVRLAVEKFKTAIEPSDLAPIEGRPCFKVTSLAALTGYCRTQGFQLNGSWLKGITDRVNTLLDSGIFIE